MYARDVYTLSELSRECVDVRRVMTRAWADDQIGRDFALDLMDVPPHALRPEHTRFAHIIREVARDSLARALPFLADEGMVELLDVAAPTMPDQQLDLRQTLAEHGWLWFGTPLPNRTQGPDLPPLRALQWTLLPADHPLLVERSDGKTPHLLLTAYSGTVEIEQARLRREGITDTKVELAPNAPRLSPASTVVWAEETLIGTAYGEVPDDPDLDPGYYQRLAAAFWTLAQQERLTETVEAASGNRAFRRRARHAGVLDPDAPVRIIRLRPRKETRPRDGAPSGRTVGVRFPVRPHWRNQWYPSLERHRHALVEGHWRGPADAPVVGGERVFLAHAPKRRPDEDA